MRKLTVSGLFLGIILNFLSAQTKIEGYVYEENNRGFLNLVAINIVNNTTGVVVGETFTNMDGVFEASVPSNQTYRITARKDLFFIKTDTIEVKEDKAFAKLELKRKPGYLFDVTLAEVYDPKDTAAIREIDAILGAKVEVYNNTKKKLEMELLTNSPNFNFTFEQGNHYTMLIRKKGFLNKRIEAYVNVNGCIICIDGVDSVNPGSSGVSDNLTSGFQMGTLLANVQLEKLDLNKSLIIKNIYYEMGKADITPASSKELDKVVSFLKTNPAITVELSSHTDSRGDANANMKLSQKRADAAVEYILKKGINPLKIMSRGYGELFLVNKCKDGYPCSEAEHQLNRRTELKILSIDVEEAKKEKTLPELIHEEEMERTLLELQNQEVYEIPQKETPAPDKTEKTTPNATDKTSTSKKIVTEPLIKKKDDK